MKKPALLLIVLLSITRILAQTTEVVKENQNENIREKYNVLKSNKNIKEGKYVAYYYYNPDKVICEGFYKNNLKDSLWIDYSINSIVDSGHYDHGKKVGVWMGYKENGLPQVQYDYTIKKVLYYRPNIVDKTKEYLVINGVSQESKILDRPPIYLDGSAKLLGTIARNIRYPAPAREQKKQGKVIISFVVDQDGHVSNYKVKKSVGYGCDEEAMRVVQLETGDWLPGMLDGKPVSVEYEVPINFTIG